MPACPTDGTDMCQKCDRDSANRECYSKDGKSGKFYRIEPAELYNTGWLQAFVFAMLPRQEKKMSEIPKT